MRQSLHSNDQGRCPLHSHHPHRAWPGSLTERPILTHQEEPPREPLEEIQVDFKDSGIPAAPSGEGKKQHVVEAMNFVDAGTSVLLAAKVQDDFRAHTALEAIIDFLREHGCPPRLSIDHDPRWVGGPGGWDFPSALLRFLAAVGEVFLHFFLQHCLHFGRYQASRDHQT